MAKQPKKPIEKKVFDIEAYKKARGLNKVNKLKDLSWIPLSSAFHEALGIPGFARGYTSLVRGYSNTGKSTAIIEAIIGAQKIGDFPIIFDTENNFDWEHARTIGMQFEEVVDESTGEVIDYAGDFLHINSRKLVDMYSRYDYEKDEERKDPIRNVPVVEDIARFMEEMIEDQEKGEFPRSICFLWDSIGSLDCYKAAKSKCKNNMWNAGALETSFKAILNFLIPDSKRQDYPYINTFVAVQKIWFDNMNTVVKHKGGEAFFYGARIIIHFGNILTHGTEKLNAEITSKGVKMKYQYGIKAAIKCEKNQVNGIEQIGKIASTSHGYWNPDKLTEYKAQNKDYILKRLQTDLDDFDMTEEVGEFSAEDVSA